MKSRLDKLLADNGWGSRRDIKRILRERAFAVNGVTTTDPACKVDPATDLLTLRGEPVELRFFSYLMLNKCAGVVTSTSDPVNRTVIDLLDPPWSSMSLFPVGRLDVDTEGLLVITNDGPLTHRITSPKSGCEKTYFARLRDPVDDAALAEYRARFRSGITFHDGYTCLPAEIARASEGPASPSNEVLVVIREGKYHQVKKMLKVVGNEVVYLKRIAMGRLSLDPSLEPGRYRELTAAEIDLLRGEAPPGESSYQPPEEPPPPKPPPPPENPPPPEKPPPENPPP